MSNILTVEVLRITAQKASKIGLRDQIDDDLDGCGMSGDDISAATVMSLEFGRGNS